MNEDDFQEEEAYGHNVAGGFSMIVSNQTENGSMGWGLGVRTSRKLKLPPIPHEYRLYPIGDIR